MQSKNYTSSALRNKFFKIIEIITPKELEYITSKSLFEELGVSEQETSYLLDNLVSEGVLKRKYVFDCLNSYCEEKVIVFDEELDDFVQCEYCEKEFKPQSNLELLNEIYYEFNAESDKQENGNYGVNFKKYFGNNEKRKIILMPNMDKQQIMIDDKDSNSSKNGGRNMKIFISHSENDKALVRFLINLLEGMGVPKDKEHIFCSSYPGFGVECGEDILDYIKKEFVKEEIIVLYVITGNFLDSKACLCEMGGAWVLSKMFIPLIMPPASFDAIQGTLLKPSIKGIKLDDYIKLDELMDKVSKEFGIKKDLEKWNIAKNEFIENIKLI